ncbi:hypothetical protein Nmn1133_00910 [Halosegnis longus]|uniref:Uncharacterized protein n=2 Tax=Halosegnis longus TaxID=2216012 RepID=A0AAJ4R6U2_9EURY|nr:hypothetical protein Nmn1133_00910 [Salella cibi]
MRRLAIALVGVLLLAGVATGVPLPTTPDTQAQPTAHHHGHGNHTGCDCPHGHEHEHGGHGHTHGSHDAQPCHHAGQQPPTPGSRSVEANSRSALTPENSRTATATTTAATNYQP